MERPPSPCIKVCVLDGAGRCTGCLRTLDEIAAWASMSAEAQWAVVRALENRRETVADDVMTRIKTHIGSSPAVLFMKGTPDFPQCGFSANAVGILRACGVDQIFTVNVLENPDIRQGGGLHGIEVVEQADPEDAGAYVKPACERLHIEEVA